MSVARFGAGWPKRVWRQLKVSYAGTHGILAQLELGMVYSPQSLMIAVENYQQARAWSVRAARLPRTKLGWRTRKLAADNESVALEVLEVLSARLNRVPRLH